MVAERENIQVHSGKAFITGDRIKYDFHLIPAALRSLLQKFFFFRHLNVFPLCYHVELADIKTAVSEAVTNAIIHGYENLSGYTKHGEMRPAYSIIHPGKVMKASIKANPMPDRSSSGFVVNNGSMALATSSMPFP